MRMLSNVLQYQTIMQDNVPPIMSVVNAPFIEVTSVNGMTGDVVINPVIDNFKSNYYYVKNSVVSYEGGLYLAKNTFTSGVSFNASDWSQVQAASDAPTVNSASIDWHSSSSGYKKVEIRNYNTALGSGILVFARDQTFIFESCDVSTSGFMAKAYEIGTNNNKDAINTGNRHIHIKAVHKQGKSDLDLYIALDAYTFFNVQAPGTIKILDSTKAEYDGVTANATIRYVPSYAPTEEIAAKNWTTYNSNTVKTPTDDTTAKWKTYGTSIHWYSTAGQLSGQPSTYGFLVNYVQSGDVYQMWHCQSGGPLYLRSGNASGWSGSWKRIAYQSEIPTNLVTATQDGIGKILTSGGTTFSPVVNSDTVNVGENTLTSEVEGIKGRLDSIETEPIPSSRISYLDDSPKVTRVYITTPLSNSIQTVTLKSGRQINIHAVNAGTGFILENAPSIDFVRIMVRAWMNVAVTGNYGVHGVTSDTTIWTYASGMTSEHTGSWSETHKVLVGYNYGDAIVAAGNKGLLGVNYTAIRMADRTFGLMGSVMCSGSGSNVNFNIECNAKDSNTVPALYLRGANDTNIVNSTGILEIYEN